MRFNIQKRTLLLFLGIALGFVVFTCCGGSVKEPTYKELTFRDTVTQFTTHEIPSVNHFAKSGKYVYVSANQYIWSVDIDTGKETPVVKDGVGPDEIYNPFRLKYYANRIYVNSLNNTMFLYRFDPGAEKQVHRIKFQKPVSFDDFLFLDKNRLVAAYVNWEDGFVRCYDLREGKVERETGTNKIHETMLRFNVNRASLCLLGDNLYVGQAIEPVIRVFSMAGFEMVDSIKLNPPFYKAMPKKYDVPKYDDQKHREWMGSWTRLTNISAKKNWLLIAYRWGYDLRYNYELIDTRDPDRRYYIAQTPNRIYDFEPRGNTIEFDVIEELEERILWKKSRVYL